MHEERMHANLRQYRIAPDNIDEAMHLADLHLADRLAEEPGFVAYELMATEDGTVCLMTIFQDPRAPSARRRSPPSSSGSTSRTWMSSVSEP